MGGAAKLTEDFPAHHNSRRAPASLRPMSEKSSLASPANNNLSATVPEIPQTIAWRRVRGGMREAAQSRRY
jgi:hypothetical protein